MKKYYLAILVGLCVLALVTCTKEKENENGDNSQFPTSGILYKGDMHIYVMNVDGTNPRKISLSKENYDEDYPSSSPDGKKIVFRRYSKGIVIHDASGEKIILNDDNIPLFTTWSDNSKIFYTRWNEMTSGAKRFVYSVNADGTGDSQISPVFNNTTDPLDYHPSVSPDKSHILISTDRQANGGTIMKIKLSDGSSSYLTYSGNTLGETVICPADYPTWSPDGTKIAFSAYPGYPDFRKKQIYIMNADGSGKIALTNETEAGCEYPSWSPDGTKIVFQKLYESFSNGSAIWIMNADGTGAKALTDRMKTGWEMHPSFIGKPR